MRRTFLQWATLGFGILAAAGFGAACSSTGGEAPQGESEEDNLTNSVLAQKLFDVNDVSILFPRDASGEPQPSIKMSDIDGSGTEFWPAQTFDQVTKFATAGVAGKPETQSGIAFADGEDKRENWRVVGMRFDPCAPTTKTRADDPTHTKLESDPALDALKINECIVQVRLIVQPIASGQDLDVTAHLVYNLGTPSALGPKFAPLLQQLVGGLREIKDASTKAGATTIGRTLGVHPGLARDPKVIGPLVRKFIDAGVAVSSAGEKLGAPSKAIAFMGLQGGGPEPWAFFAGRVVQPAGWSPLTMPAFPKTPTFVQKLSFLSRDRVVPKSELPTSTQPLFTSSASSPNPTRDAEVAFGIEQPEGFHFFTMDCVSCHTSSSRAILLNLKSGPARSKTPFGITGYGRREHAQDSTWNVRNFGYFLGKATVSTRTVTETVGVVKYVNTVLLPEAAELATKNAARVKAGKTPFFGPARDCTAVEDEVYDCFTKGGSDDDNNDLGNGKCTAKCGAFASNLKDDQEPEEPPPPPPIKPLPKDPCKAESSAVVVINADGTATITGTRGQCLSRSLGSFRSVPVDIVCPETGTCIVDVRKGPKVTFTGIPARRLISALRVQPAANGHEVFEASGPKNAGPKVSIDCVDGARRSCTVSVTK